MLFTNPIIFDNVLSFVRVWRNEFTRVICDRFNSEQVILSIYLLSISKYLDHSKDEQLMTMRIEETLGIYFPNEKNEILMNPLIFGDFKDALNEDIPIKLYEDYETYESILKMFIEVKYSNIKIINKKNTVLTKIIFIY